MPRTVIGLSLHFDLVITNFIKLVVYHACLLSAILSQRRIMWVNRRVVEAMMATAPTFTQLSRLNWKWPSAFKQELKCVHCASTKTSIMGSCAGNWYLLTTRKCGKNSPYPYQIIMSSKLVAKNSIQISGLYICGCTHTLLWHYYISPSLLAWISSFWHFQQLISFTFHLACAWVQVHRVREL